MATSNIIGVEDHHFYRLFTLSSKCASPVIQKAIEEFCSVNTCTFQHFLDHHKHDIFHMRSGASSCCLCRRQFVKLLSDVQWNILYNNTSISLTSSHPHYGHDIKKCPEAFTVPSGVGTNVCDVTLASFLILNTNDLLLFILEKLCGHLGSGGSNGVEIFLAQHQHAIFHNMEKRSCCQCANDPEGKDVIKRNEWNSMYVSSLTGCASPVCSCQYRPKTQVSLQALQQQVLRKLGQSVSPLTTIRNVRNSLAHSSSGILAVNDFNAQWNLLAGALDDLMSVISDASWVTNMKRNIADLKVCPISTSMWEEYRNELHQWLRENRDLQELFENLQSRQAVLESRVDTLQTQQTDNREHLENLQSRQAVLESRVDNLQTQQSDNREHLEERISSLCEVLQTINHEETERVLLAPLQIDTAKPIDKIYAPVMIRKDLEEELKNHMLPEGKEKSEPELVTGPQDIFQKNGEPTRFVMMQGEAGRGKSVYCLQLMKYWCNAKKASASKHTLSEWERWLVGYDCLFSIRLRDVDTDRVFLSEMICDFIRIQGFPGYTETICHVLSNDKIRCLFIVDGLDEWPVPDEMKSKLTFSCLPNIRDIENSTFFFTMRPWKFEAVRWLLNSKDRVVEIQGLDNDGITTVIENILVHHYHLKNTSSEYETQLRKIKEKASDRKLKSLLQAPLITVVSTMMFFENKVVGNSITTFYIALLSMLIERAIKCRSVDENIQNSMRKIEKDTIKIPQILQRENVLNGFIDVLYILGEIAFKDLTSTETHLVFEKRELEKKLGKSELEFALKVGLLTQSETTGDAHTKHVSVSFFHKTVQEILTAMHVSSKKEVSELFLEHLSSIEIIMEFENVNMFVSGLSPSLGETLSQHIAKVANTDPDICRYRESIHYKLENKVKLLYKMQLACLRELQQSGEDISHSTQQRDYHISDVYVGRNSDTDTVCMTADALRHHNTNIVSLCIGRVPNDRQDDIDDAVIHDYLQQTTTLTTLYISGYNTNRTLHTINTVTSLKALVLVHLSITPSLLHDIQTSLHNNTHIHRLSLVGIKCVDSCEVRQRSLLDNFTCCIKCTPTLTTSFCGLLQNLPSCKHLSWLDISYMLKKEERDMLVNVLPDLSHLKSIQYAGSTYYDVDDGEYDYTIVHMVSQWTQLQGLWLAYISLGDRSLELPADMDHIEMVWLGSVKMSAGGWGKFITSLINIQHQFDVRLVNTDISADCVTMIRSSPHFTVTRHDEGKSELHFTRKFPPTSQTQEHSDGVTGAKQST